MVNAVQMKCLRRTATKTRWDWIRNERIWEELQLPSVRKRIEDKQLFWCGHVMQMGRDCKACQFIEAKPLGQRQVGRPRTIWEESVKHVVTRRGKTMSQI